MAQNLRTLKLTLSIKFILCCSLILTIALGISFYIIAKQQERLIMEQIEYEARALFRHIVITRKWVSDHQGVFVEKLPWVKENPYLKNIEAEIVDIKGKRYVRKNPAMVTRELSEYAKEKGLFWFHITSLKLMNPENTPDEFERNALFLFEQNHSNELMTISSTGNSKFFRYISPLYVEDSCMSCHAHQGYKIGDVRGAISITIPIDKTYAYIESNKKNMMIAGLLTLFSLIIGISILIRRLILIPMNKLKTSIDEFSGGKFSPLSNINTGDEFEELYISFSSMAESLKEYHLSLNDKIRAATMDIELTNTRLIEMNSLLKEASIRKSDFIARASHELRTPLTSIKGAIDYINARFSINNNEKEGYTVPDEILIFLEIIKKNSERLIRMVNDMLDLERIEQGRSELNLSNIKPSCLIEETITYFRIEAEKKNIRFTTFLDCELSVCADEDRIRQVLSNLLTNAIKFSPDNSEIAVHAYTKEGLLNVRICDQGPGIEYSKQDIIFEKFFKYGNKEGAGLGLAICKRIVEAHGGSIGVQSDGKKGCCFYFKLPLNECEKRKIENDL